MDTEDPDIMKKQDFNDSGCVHDASMTDGSYRGHAQLLDLSDDVLLLILQHCTPHSLKALGHTCPRLGALVCDRTLWGRVDGLTEPTGQKRLRWMLTHGLHGATSELKLRGFVDKENKCGGLQEPQRPREPETLSYVQGTVVRAPMTDEHFMLRMWYPPRSSINPYWPDTSDSKTNQAEKSPSWEPPMPGPSTSAQNTSNSNQNSGDLAQNSGEDKQNMENSGENHQSSDKNSGSKKTSSPSAVTPNLKSNSNKRMLDSSENELITGDIESSSSKKSDTSVTKDCETQAETGSSNSNSGGEDSSAVNCPGPHFTLTNRLLKELRIKCPSLSTLFLEYCDIDCKKTTIRQFPTTLKKLSLKGTRCFNLTNPASYLNRINDRMPELEYLDLSECDWLDPANLMPLSKIAKLRTLVMRECSRLTECVAYASLSARYGFRLLEYLDIRGSLLSDSEVMALGWLPRVTHLLVSPARAPPRPAHHHAAPPAARAELQHWEMEEPEYFKCKSQDFEEAMEDEEEPKEEATPPRRNDEQWFPPDRRVIVIQPSRDQLRRPRPINEEQPNAPDGNPPAPINQNDQNHSVDTQNVNSKRKKLNNEPSTSTSNNRRSPNNIINIENTPSTSKNCVLNENAEISKLGPIFVLKRSNNRIVDDDDDDEPKSKQQYVTVGRRNSEIIIKKDYGNHPSSSGECSKNSGESSENSGESSKNSGENSTNSGESSKKSGENSASKFKSTKKFVRLGSGVAISIEPSNSNHIKFKRVFENNSNGETPQNFRAANNSQNSQNHTNIEVTIYKNHSDNYQVASRNQENAEENSNSNSSGNIADAEQDNSNNENEGSLDVRIERNLDPNNRDSTVTIRPSDPNVRCIIMDRPNQNCISVSTLPLSNNILNPRIPRLAPPNMDNQSVQNFNPIQPHRLITDTAILHFGRATNNSMNYVHIGRNGGENSAGMRPERSTLRVLSVTGYSQITDESLVHLATAAPHLRTIDFSQSNVTEKGVELFKSLRPDCEVIYSKFCDK